MIKINLLGVAPPPTKIISAGGTPAPKATQIIMFVGAVIVFFGIVGIIYKIWTNQIADLEKARDHEKVRAAELASVKAQNAKYQQRLKDLDFRSSPTSRLEILVYQDSPARDSAPVRALLDYAKEIRIDPSVIMTGTNYRQP